MQRLHHVLNFRIIALLAAVSEGLTAYAPSYKDLKLSPKLPKMSFCQKFRRYPRFFLRKLNLFEFDNFGFNIDMENGGVFENRETMKVDNVVYSRIYGPIARKLCRVPSAPKRASKPMKQRFIRLNFYLYLLLNYLPPQFFFWSLPTFKVCG